jgi:tetratricopeptide (TPR) repeat protein
LAVFPVVARLATIALSYCGYLQKVFVPVDLAPIYPWSKAPNYAVAAACTAALAIGTFLLLWGGLFARGSGRRYLAVGWLWYLGLLVPVIGVVQVGQQAMADRYTYLPIVGIFILVAWSSADVLARWPSFRFPMAALAAAVLATCCVLTSAQVRLWASTKTLFAHNVAVTRDNPVALTNLGVAAIKEERYEDAQRYLGEALRLDRGEMDAWGNLANLYRNQKKYDDALRAYAKVDQLCPGNAKCYCQTADTLKEMGNLKGAEAYYSRAVQVEPASAVYLYLLAMTQQSQGNYREALKNYDGILRLDPGNPAAHNNIAWLCATCPDSSVRNGARGIELLAPGAEKPDCDPNLLDTLAAAYAEAGQFDRAVDTAAKAIAKAREQSLPSGAVADMEKRLVLYKKRQPYREP